MAIEGRSDATLFGVTGWQERHPIECRLQSRSVLSACRKQVAYETARFDQRLPDLERRLAGKKQVPSAVEASKQRGKFDLKVDPDPVADSGPALSRVLALPTPDQDDSRIIPEFVGMQAVSWLSLRFPQGGILFSVGGGDNALGSLVGDFAGLPYEIHEFVPGEGAATPSVSAASDRYRAQPGSFAAWHLEVGSQGLGAVLAFLMGNSATILDIDLLRFRLFSHHILVIPEESALRDKLLSSWDGTVYQLEEYLVFADPGPQFLDPIHAIDTLADDATVVWPRISVVTVSYNQAAYLEECLLSVLQQDYPNIEYIVIDACSTDGSQEILQSYADRINHLVIEPDDGQSDGLTKGFSFATGEILTWVNSDDLLAPGALKRVAITFLTYDCDLVAGGCDRVTENTEQIIARHHAALPLLKVTELGLHHNLMWHDSWEKGDYFFQPEVFFSADIWRRSGAYLKLHLYWAMDYDLWLRMALAGAQVVHIPEILALSRIHDEQKTTQDTYYLYQLKNILLEYDDLFEVLEQHTTELPEGDYQYQPPVQVAAQATPPETRGLSLPQRLRRLRHPENLVAAIKNRLPAPFKERLRPLWHLRRPRKLARSVFDRSPPFAKELARYIVRRAKYSRKGYRIVSSLHLAELKARSDMLQVVGEDARSHRLQMEHHQNELLTLREHVKDIKEAMGANDQRHRAALSFYETAFVQQEADLKNTYEISLQQMQESLSTDLDETKAAYENSLQQMRDSYSAELAAANAERDSLNAALAALKESEKREAETRQAILQELNEAALLNHGAPKILANGVGFLLRLLFGEPLEQSSIKHAQRLLLNNKSLPDIVHRLLAEDAKLKSTPRFRIMRRLLATTRPFPKSNDIAQKLKRFSIIDVGSEELSMENDIYVGLASQWKCRVYGFDPFQVAAYAEASHTTYAESEPKRHYEVMTQPYFVGDGGKATFHVNHFRPTSSLKATNHNLVDHFGLLGESLETIETFEVETHPLDALMAPFTKRQRFYDFIKIDVQGGTLEILSNANQTLKKTLVCHLEAEFAEVYEGENLFSDIHAFMHTKGFDLVDFCNPGHESYFAYDKAPEKDFHASRLLWSDCIYMRRMDSLKKGESIAILRMAVTMHEIYRKYDLTAHLLKEYDARTGESLHKSYIETL